MDLHLSPLVRRDVPVKLLARNHASVVALTVGMKILWDIHGICWCGRLYRLTRSLLPTPIVATGVAVVLP